MTSVQLTAHLSLDNTPNHFTLVIITMTTPITPRVALVTGCSEPESLGAQLALSLAKEHGFRVFATARNVKSLSGLAAEGLDVSMPLPPFPLPANLP